MMPTSRALRCAPILLLAACAAVTTVPLAWRNPEYTGGPVDRIFVIGVAKDPLNRRVFEDRFVAVLAERGVSATSSYHTLPSTGRLEEGDIRGAMQDGRHDAVLITRLLGEEEKTEWVPGRTYTVPAPYYGGYYGYYHDAWDVVHEPGYYDTYTVVRLETNLYTVADTKLVWSGQSETMDPRSDAETIESVTAAVAKKLAQDGIIR